MKNTGKITQIIGPVVDVKFEGQMPLINNALETKIEVDDKVKTVVLEVAQHLGKGQVRSVAMDSTDGLKRSIEVVDTGAPISVPVGGKVLGRMFDVLGNPIDGKGEVKSEKKYPIHRDAPAFKEQSTKTRVFETGIKVIDLICPFLAGGKVGLFGGAVWGRQF